MKVFSLALIIYSMMNHTGIGSTKTNAGADLFYIVKEPRIKTGKPPVIILLHGIGSNEEDLFSFADQLPAHFLVVSVRAPYTVGPGSYAWYDLQFVSGKPVINKEQAEKSRNTIIRFVHQLSGVHPYDESKIYLCGFSQGAMMAYSVGLSQPDLFKGIAVLSGRLPEEIKPLIHSGTNLSKLNIFITHGINDMVIEVRNARESLTYLKSIHLNPAYKEYPEGHGVNNDMLTDLVNWLNK